MDTSYQPPPITWDQFPIECFWYVYPFMWAVHLVIFFIGFIISAMLPLKQPGTLKRRTKRLGLFVLILLFVGALFNGLWSCLIWGRLYYSSDYIFDFSPFWPITRSIIDDPFDPRSGELFGVSLLQLQLIWLLFAAGTWAVTIYLYRIIRRRLAANAASQHTVPSP